MTLFLYTLPCVLSFVEGFLDISPPLFVQESGKLKLDKLFIKHSLKKKVLREHATRLPHSKETTVTTKQTRPIVSARALTCHTKHSNTIYAFVASSAGGCPAIHLFT